MISLEALFIFKWDRIKIGSTQTTTKCSDSTVNSMERIHRHKQVLMGRVTLSPRSSFLLNSQMLSRRHIPNNEAKHRYLSNTPTHHPSSRQSEGQWRSRLSLNCCIRLPLPLSYRRKSQPRKTILFPNSRIMRIHLRTMPHPHPVTYPTSQELPRLPHPTECSR